MHDVDLATVSPTVKESKRLVVKLAIKLSVVPFSHDKNEVAVFNEGSNAKATLRFRPCSEISSDTIPRRS